MRVAVLVMLASAFLAGCTYDPDPADSFERTCPAWFPSPSTPQWASPQGAMRHDADSPNEEVQEPTDRSKWIPVPGHAGGSVTRYHEGTLAYVELEFVNVTLLDSLLVFESYRAADSEPTTTDPEHDRPIDPTGPRLQFSTQPQRGGQVTSEVRFGPHVGDEDPLVGLDAHVYVDLVSAGASDPSRIRIDAIYTGNQDGDPTTDAVAIFDLVKATFWYLHDDCA